MVNNEDYLAAQIIGLGMQMLITISIAIVLFVGITCVYRGIFSMIGKYKTKKERLDMETDKLVLKNLTKKYRELTVVNDVSFDVQRGQPMAIIGRNGAGKSTIIKMILGLLGPTSGEIKIPIGFKVGYLPEERGVYQDVTVEEHLELFARLAGVKRVSDAVNKCLKRFEIEHYRKFPLKSLSKGNAQRVQFAIALINAPDLLILDEPLSGLDPMSSKMFQDIILEESKEKILITTSHNMNYIEKLCAKVTLLDKGNQIVCGEINELKKIYGRKKLSLPKNESFMIELKEYNPIFKEDCITNRKYTRNG